LVDARVDAAHPMLRNVEVREAHFEDGVPAATDHATALASVFAARQDHVTLYSASVFTGTGGDTFGASASSIALALNWLAESGVQAINVSLSGPPNPILESVIRRLAARGHVVVAAVGNDGPSRTVRFPAAYPEAVAVTAVDARHAVYRYANRGPEVDFSAVGVGLTVAARDGGVQSVSGTSFAAPIVTLEIARAAGPSGGAMQAKEMLRNLAADLGAPGPDPVFGWGLIGERRAVAADTVFGR
jgi:subtilisin family serine protease